MLSKGDRFISQRSMEGDDSERQRIKQELYSATFHSPQKSSKRDGQCPEDDGQQPKDDNMQIEEE